MSQMQLGGLKSTVTKLTELMALYTTSEMESNPVGMTHIVTTDFNPLLKNKTIYQSAIGTIHIVVMDFNPLL